MLVSHKPKYLESEKKTKFKLAGGGIDTLYKLKNVISFQLSQPFQLEPTKSEKMHGVEWMVSAQRTGSYLHTRIII